MEFTFQQYKSQVLVDCRHCDQRVPPAQILEHILRSHPGSRDADEIRFHVKRMENPTVAAIVRELDRKVEETFLFGETHRR